MLGIAKRIFPKASLLRVWAVRAVGFLIAGFGVYAFIKRDIGSYMFLKTQFHRLRQKLFHLFHIRRRAVGVGHAHTAQANRRYGQIFSQYSFFHARLMKLQASAANVEAFIEKAKQYTAINELTPELLRLFIQRIEVGERSVKYSRNAEQHIRIFYRDIGRIDSAMRPGEKPVHIVPPISEMDLDRIQESA